jgi:hypothetical protein
VSHTFNGGASQGCGLLYAWGFGGGDGSLGPTATFTPQGFYAYPVALTVTDVFGRASTVTHTVDSTEEPQTPGDGSRTTESAPSFRWLGNANIDDEAEIWDRNPASGAKPLQKRFESQGAIGFNKAEGIKSTSFGFLPLGVYYWRVIRSSGDGPVWMFTVRAPRLRQVSVTTKEHFGQLSTSPGATQLKIRAAPYSRVALRVSYSGHPYASVSFTPSVRPTDTIQYPWSCSQAGTFHYVVTASDNYGDSRTSRGTWLVSSARCRHLERLEAQKRAALVAAIHHRDSACTFRGGTNATIGGAYQCLRPNSPCYPYLESQYEKYGYNCHIVGGIVIVVVIADLRRGRRMTDGTDPQPRVGQVHQRSRANPRPVRGADARPRQSPGIALSTHDRSATLVR